MLMLTCATPFLCAGGFTTLLKPDTYQQVLTNSRFDFNTIFPWNNLFPVQNRRTLG